MIRKLLFTAIVTAGIAGTMMATEMPQGSVAASMRQHRGVRLTPRAGACGGCGFGRPAENQSPGCGQGKTETIIFSTEYQEKSGQGKPVGFKDTGLA